MLFGPLYTEEDVTFTMRNAIFENLEFLNDANMIFVNQQTKYPLYIEKCSFKNIKGGHVMLDPPTRNADSVKARLTASDITVTD